MIINYILLIFLVLSFLLCFYIELKYLSPSIILWIGLIGIFLIPHLLHIFFQDITAGLLIRASVFVTGFNLLYFATKLIIVETINKHKYNWIFVDLITSKSERVKRLLSFLSFMGLFLWLLALLIAGVNPVRSEWKDTMEVSSLLSQTGNILIFSSSGIILYSYLTGKRRLLIVELLIYIACIFILRARILLIPVLIPFALLILFRNNRINFKLKFFFIILFFVVSIFMLQALRWRGGLNEFSIKKIPDYISVSLKNLTGKAGEFHLVTEFYSILENENRFEHFGEGRTYWRIALFWLPRSVLPEKLKFLKPRDFAIDMYNFIYKTPKNNYGTTHPTFYGDLYANFGWFGLLFAIFWVLVTEFFDRLFKKNKLRMIFLLGSISTFYIMLARGAVYNASFILLLTVIIVSSLFLRFQKGKLFIFRES